ncbi:CRISPR-associated endonuclease Cas2 [Halomonas sp. LS-001]
MSQPQWHLIAYDIRDVKRLRRVHTCLQQCAFALQRSVFLWQGDARQLAVLKQQLSQLINPLEDDIRGYPMACGEPIHCWGKLPFMEGMFMEGLPRLEIHPLPGQY